MVNPFLGEEDHQEGSQGSEEVKPARLSLTCCHHLMRLHPCRFESIHLSFQSKMPELPGSGCVVADGPAAAAAVVPAAVAAAAAVVGEVPEIAASAVLVHSEELPVGSDVVKVRILDRLLVVLIRTF